MVCGGARQFVCQKPDSDQSSSASPSPACSCASDWRADLDTNKCYKRLDSPGSGLSWADARTQCEVRSLLSVLSVQREKCVAE